MIHDLILIASTPADPWTLPRLIELGIGGIAMGLVVWLVRHVTTKTIPDMNNKHQEQTTKQLEVFERVNKEQRVEFREILESDRELHYRREAALRGEFKTALDEFKQTQSELVGQLANSSPGK